MLGWTIKSLLGVPRFVMQHDGYCSETPSICRSGLCSYFVVIFELCFIDHLVITHVVIIRTVIIITVHRFNAR